MSEVISSINSLKAGLQVFALLTLFLCVILHTMWSGKNLQLLCHLYDVCKNYAGRVYVGGYGGLGKSVCSVHCDQSAFL